jgi:hypothetical protein
LGHNSEQTGKEKSSWEILKMEAAIPKRWDLYDDLHGVIFQRLES